MKKKQVLKIKLYIFSLLLLTGCSDSLDTEEKLKSEGQRIVEEIKDLAKVNPIISDVAQSQTFKVIYDVDDYRELKPLVKACRTFIDASPYSHEYRVYSVPEELYTLASKKYTGLLEKFMGANSPSEDFVGYMEYFTGSYQNFMTPSMMTRQGIDQKIDTLRNKEGYKEFQKDFNKKLKTGKSDPIFRGFFGCVMIESILSPIGMDTIAKSIAGNLSSHISRENLGQLNELMQ
ncbi:MAG: hypothetical protein KC478_13500 [Bacteriovoracaceae bacterium]|nr:hypothetical protein [Bacteriovoracaceae bacterium]